MTLLAQFKLRLSAQLLITWTNPDDPTANASDDVFLQDACDDVEDGEFVAWMGEDYDETIKSHILAAVQLVKLKLVEMGAAPNITYEKMLEQTEKRIERYRNVRSRDRVAPTSSSQLTPSDEVQSGQTRRPAMDDQFFGSIIPEDPPSDSDPSALD